jgi:acyl-CoA synthetase (AMP-forming)/AMP-acid ligase II
VLLANHAWHTECYFGAPAIGAVYHPLNFRLSADDIVYIINNAEDRILIINEPFMGEHGELPWDGESAGELQARGPFVTGSYYRSDHSDQKFTADGWFPTGDIALIDPEGYLQIVDREKDLIKSGGEWISSVLKRDYGASERSRGGRCRHRPS